jgi:C4-type Zn-finger protein
MVASGTILPNQPYTIPLDIAKKIGVYRLIIRDNQGISGEMTFSVESGKLTQSRITPISSVLVRGQKTLAMIRLLDRLGNPTSPDLHSLSMSVDG